MKRRILTVSGVVFLAVALCGCSNQQGSLGTNQNSEMNATEVVTPEDSSEVTEEILAEINAL